MKWLEQDERVDNDDIELVVCKGNKEEERSDSISVYILDNQITM